MMVNIVLIFKKEESKPIASDTDGDENVAS